MSFESYACGGRHSKPALCLSLRSRQKKKKEEEEEEEEEGNVRTDVAGIAMDSEAMAHLKEY